MLENFMRYMRNHGYIRTFTMVGLGFLVGIVLYLLRFLPVHPLLEDIIFYTCSLIILTLIILLGFFINLPVKKLFFYRSVQRLSLCLSIYC
ncbi:hypothetical protein GCM10010954_29650 [Halobacillus andaensis]|uniref:Uncharacterized protein n=1 Tax=Halobacillus andaensis TaxID=1176239 RepID=A0A917EZW8_HALAA|nr:hypothetical protein [Halobacillus andaensis]MBP2005069.1 putative membrane protein [Halobacillus andaensis]GGF28648.1 hypothetical protein GCM10010954_29650 [Halobacillus andaensis]